MNKKFSQEIKNDLKIEVACYAISQEIWGEAEKLLKDIPEDKLTTKAYQALADIAGSQNNPEVVKREIEEKEEIRFVQPDLPREVRILDGQQVNTEPKERFGGLAKKLSELPPKEREEFIEDRGLDKKLIETLELPKEKKEDERFEIRRDDDSKRKGK